MRVNPRTAAASRRELLAKLRELIDQLDAGTIVVRGYGADGAAHNTRRLREHLEARIAKLEGRQ